MCFDLFSMERSFASTARKKYEITLEVIMIRSLISEIKEFKKPSILASLFMVFEVMFEISIPFVMASLFGPGCSTKKHEQYFVLRLGLDAGLCLLLPLLWDVSLPVMAPMHRLVLPKTFVGPFSKRFKPSHLRILISSHQVG